MHDDESDFHDSDSDSDSSDFDPSAILVDQDSESEDERDISYGIHAENTRRLQNQMEGNLSEKVQKVLFAMESVGINLPIFLDALSWGDAECIADSKIQYARSSLLMSAELPGILQRWWKPPRASGSRKARPRGARPTMEQFAISCVDNIVENEMEKLGPVFRSPVGEDVKEETLTEFHFQTFIDQVKELAPQMWSFLWNRSYSLQQRNRNTRKVPEKVSTIFTISKNCIQLTVVDCSHYRVNAVVFSFPSSQQAPETVRDLF